MRRTSKNWKLEAATTAFLWDPGGTNIGVSLIPPCSSSGKVTYAEFSLSPNVRVPISNPQGLNIKFMLKLPPGDYQLVLTQLQVDGGIIPKECFQDALLRVSILSPFYHWQCYEKRSCNFQYLVVPCFFLPNHLKVFSDFINNQTMKVLWISGGPGYGKTFFAEKHIIKELENQGIETSQISLPIPRWEVISKLYELLDPNHNTNPTQFKYDTTLQNISKLLYQTQRQRIGYVLVDNSDKIKDGYSEIVFELMNLFLRPPDKKYPFPGKLIIIDSLPFEDRLFQLLAEDNNGWDWLRREHEDLIKKIQQLKMFLWTESQIKDMVGNMTNFSLTEEQLSHLYRTTAGHPYLTAAYLDKSAALYRMSVGSSQSPLISEIKIQLCGNFLFKIYIKRGFLTRNEAKFYQKILRYVKNRGGYIPDAQINPEGLKEKGLLLNILGRLDEYKSVFAFEEVNTL